MPWTVRFLGAHAFQVLQIISIPDKIKLRAVSSCQLTTSRAVKETQKSNAEVETGCILCTCKRAEIKKSNLRPAKTLHADSACHEISISVPQNQSSGQGNKIRAPRQKLAVYY